MNGSSKQMLNFQSLMQNLMLLKEKPAGKILKLLEKKNSRSNMHPSSHLIIGEAQRIKAKVGFLVSFIKRITPPARGNDKFN